MDKQRLVEILVVSAPVLGCLVYKAYRSLRELRFCPFFFIGAPNLCPIQCNMCWNLVKFKRWPSQLRFIGFLPENIEEFGSKNLAHLAELGTYHRKPFEDPLWPEDSSFWFQNHQVLLGTSRNRCSFWRYSLLTGFSKPVFSVEFDRFDSICSNGIVEKYLVAVIKKHDEDEILVRIANSHTGAVRTVRLTENPPEMPLIRGQRWFNFAGVFRDCVVLFACQVFAWGWEQRQVWAHKYVPSDDPDVWKLKTSSCITRQLDLEEVHPELISIWHKLTESSFGFSFTNETDDSHNYVYDSRGETWSKKTDDEVRQLPHKVRFEAWAKFLKFSKHLVRHRRRQFQFCGYLGHLGNYEDDGYYQGRVIAAPREFARKDLPPTLDESPALFLAPHHPTRSLKNLAFASLMKSFPGLKELDEKELRTVGIPPGMAATLAEHTAWGTGRIVGRDEDSVSELNEEEYNDNELSDEDDDEDDESDEDSSDDEVD